MSKDFLGMLDSLPTEQKQPFIDHFVQTIFWKTYNAADPYKKPYDIQRCNP